MSHHASLKILGIKNASRITGSVLIRNMIYGKTALMPLTCRSIISNDSLTEICGGNMIGGL
jgi:hypothetical protein